LPQEPERTAKTLTRWPLEPVRCPFCVQGHEFRLMVDLSGGLGGTFYCTSCRHLVRAGEPEFRCLCPNCHALASSPAKT